MSNEVMCWHFLPEDGMTRFDPRQKVEVGQTLKWTGSLELCESGLHASIKPLDALTYAPGPIICRVRLTGKIVSGDDKFVASERTCLAMADATDVLWAMSRWAALQVIHLCDAPAVVRQYLETGDETIWGATWAAAWGAAWAAARGAAWGAAWDAARGAQNIELERRFKELLNYE